MWVDQNETHKLQGSCTHTVPAKASYSPFSIHMHGIVASVMRKKQQQQQHIIKERTKSVNYLEAYMHVLPIAVASHNFKTAGFVLLATS